MSPAAAESYIAIGDNACARVQALGMIAGGFDLTRIEIVEGSSNGDIYAYYQSRRGYPVQVDGVALDARLHMEVYPHETVIYPKPFTRRGVPLSHHSVLDFGVIFRPSAEHASLVPSCDDAGELISTYPYRDWDVMREKYWEYYLERGQEGGLPIITASQYAAMLTLHAALGIVQGHIRQRGKASRLSASI